MLSSSFSFRDKVDEWCFMLYLYTQHTQMRGLYTLMMHTLFSLSLHKNFMEDVRTYTSLCDNWPDRSRSEVLNYRQIGQPWAALVCFCFLTHLGFKKFKQELYIKSQFPSLLENQKIGYLGPDSHGASVSWNWAVAAPFQWILCPIWVLQPPSVSFVHLCHLTVLGMLWVGDF